MTLLKASDIPFKHYKAADLLAAKRAFSAVGPGRYSLVYPDLGITFEASQLHRNRDQQLLGELTVLTTLAGAKVIEGVLSSAEFNFSNQRARSERAGFLADRSNARDLDWVGAIETVCVQVLKAERTGETIRPLADFPAPTVDEDWTIAGIPILRQHPMILFGDGGSAKSYLALYIAMNLAVRDIRVLYVDWEFSGEDHRERLERLCGPEMPRETLQYVRCATPLVNEIAKLQGFIHAHKIDYVVCDSIGFAVPGRPEDAEHATAYARAVRAFGVGSLHLAHITKAIEEGHEKPFGSIFWHNAARSTWFVKRADDAQDPQTVEIALHHRKANTGAKQRSRGLRFSFTAARTIVEPFDVSTHQELAKALPLWQRIKGLVSHGPMSVGSIADQLEAKEDSVGRVIRRMDLFTRLADGRIGLAERRHG